MDVKEVVKIIQLYSDIYDMQEVSIDNTITNPSIFFNTIIRSLVGSYDSNLLIALYLLKHLCLDSNLNSSWREDSELLVVRLLF